MMRLRDWTILMAVGGLALALSTLWDGPETDRRAARDPAGPPMPAANAASDDQMATFGPAFVEPADAMRVTWEKTVGEGDSLSGLLTEAGLDTDARTAVIAALGSEFNLQQLKPGHSIALQLADDGSPQAAALEIETGLRIWATFGADPVVRQVAPQLKTVRRAGKATIGSSIYAALDAADIPTRFATDLELVFADTLDLRAVMGGNERLSLIWREYRAGDRVVGEPTIDYAQLDLNDARYEILWPDDTSLQTRIFKDGDLMQTLVQPIRGARLSSAFGPRMHPVHGTMRMHSGVDFAAAQGEVVAATQDGKIAFMGNKGGYGLLVEVAHAGGIKTLYAHLSAVNDALKVGQRIPAGQEIGRVGSTGTSTAPHLHYEVHVNGRPVSPLTDRRLFSPTPVADATPAPDDAVMVEDLQIELQRLLLQNG